ncbi:MAG: hypothetical protein M3Q95_09685 [Bacteroidota bacterium]|nr:hypothetical protein [Bacteroidota bacterium]
MKKKAKAQNILKELKSQVSNLSQEEQEKFRDNLLAYLLFGDQSSNSVLPGKETLKGISEAERMLIRKLAAQTEELFRTMNQEDEEEN